MEIRIERKLFCHVEGPTDICYSDDGKFILSCGCDDLRIWSGIHDNEPLSREVGPNPTSVAFSNGRIYVGTGTNIVQVYKFPEIIADGPAIAGDGKPLRFSAPVTDIDVSLDGNMLVACSCDMDIKVIDMNTKRITTLSGHSAPVLTVSLDPVFQFVASSSCDSSVKIWEISSGLVVKAFNNIIPACNDFLTATCLGRTAWESKTGLHFAIMEGKKVNIHTRNNWALKFQLISPNIEKSISIVSFSPSGSFVCAATTIGEIIIWNFSNHKSVNYLNDPNKVPVFRLRWHPLENELLSSNRLGQITGLIIRNHERQLNRGIQSHDTAAKEEEVYKEDDEENENVISIDKIKASSGWMSPSKYCGESEDDNDEDMESSHGSNKHQAAPINMQACFQPSSTPLHFQRRYLVWNSIGIVRCFNSEDEKGIEVEFHDTKFHHPLHMNNYEDYVLASLSNKVLTLAKMLAKETPSKLTTIHLNAWDGTREWNLSMPDHETIVALAASGNWICCGTDANQLRIFSYTGTQREIISLPGPIVCLNGHDNLLLVICHVGIGLPECQNLGFLIIDISDLFVRTITPFQPVSLFPKSTLKWAGFTDEGTPCIYDSEGIVRLSRDFLRWTVACDTRLQNKSAFDHYFIIGVSEKFQCIRCILCKGSYYPVTSPVPNVVEIPLRMPLCDLESDKTVLEDIFWRNIFSLSVLEKLSHTNSQYLTELQNSEKLLMQTIVKLFANACRGDNDMRAVDVAMLMSEQPLQIAIKYAAKIGKTYLIEKLSNIEAKDWISLLQNISDIADRDYFVDVCSNRSSYSKEIRNKNLQNKEKFTGRQFEGSEGVDAVLSISKKDEDDNFPNKETRNILKVPASVNPFKVSNKEGNSLKGLEFFNKLTMMKNSKAEPVSLSKTSKLKQATSKKHSMPNGQSKITFVEWFKKNNDSLQMNFPGLSHSELTKTAMKMYKDEVTQKNQNKTSENIQENSGEEAALSPEFKKRKTELLNDPNEKIKVTPPT